MKAISLIGNSKSGKTTLALELCSYFRSLDLRVGYAKHSSHGFDLRDTDTQRLSEQAQAVAGVSPDQSMVLWSGQRYLLDLVPLLQSDVLIIEGGRELKVLPRILLPKAEDQEDRQLDQDLAFASWKRQIDAQLPVMDHIQELAEYVLARGFLLPGLNCGACGRESCAHLAGEIVSGTASIDDCRALQGSMSIRINGQPLGLNPFAAGIVSGSIRGMLEQLKGYAPGTIDISLET
jgi:molybdopterin-guanine dinucleotide biosynthesis protein B